MAVKLRLTRRGKKKHPTYRVVAADSRFPRDGRFIEIVGFYDPNHEPSEVRIDGEKALKWLKNGAQPSERVKKLLEISGVWAEFTGKIPGITLTESAKAESAKTESANTESVSEVEASPDTEPIEESETKSEAESEAEAKTEASEGVKPDSAEAEPEASEATTQESEQEKD